MNKQQTPNPFICVYIARYPFDVVSDCLPLSRKNEIDSCGNVDVANSKYYVFKLLEIALKEVFSTTLAESNLVRSANGKWQCDACEISLSHCNDVVAVAVSNLPVGVDVERIAPERFDCKLQERIFTQSECALANAMTENECRLYANRIWTVKEAEFKRQGKSSFVAGAIDTSGFDNCAKTVTVDNVYYLTVVSSLNDCKVKFNAVNVALNCD